MVYISKILLCVSSSIAIYKSLDLASKLAGGGHEVVAAMTPNAQKLVTSLAFRSITRNDVITDIFSDRSTIAHISITDWCDMAVIAPASYNLIGKIAGGIADDAVSTIMAACKKRVLVAPAMNVNMYENPIFKENLEKIRKLENYNILDSPEGRLACGVTGKGRMAEPCEIMSAIDEILSGVRKEPGPLSGYKITVTAGPTREYMDSVRFLSNPSSGKMGYAIASEAAAMGAEVTLISGPVSIAAPAGIGRKIDVVTTDEMLEASIEAFDGCDAFISAAAPCDFSFSKKSPVKAKKSDICAGDTLLIETKDILKALAARKKNQIIIGFAAEDNNHYENAVKKMVSKSMNMVVLNDVSSRETGFCSDNNQITLITRSGKKSPEEYEKISKTECARIILKKIPFLKNGR